MEPGHLKHWRSAFEEFENTRRQAGEELVWVIVDGFVLFWDEVSWSHEELVRVTLAHTRRSSQMRSTSDCFSAFPKPS